jgi:hypothetical protein
MSLSETSRGEGSKEPVSDEVDDKYSLFGVAILDEGDDIACELCLPSKGPRVLRSVGGDMTSKDMYRSTRERKCDRQPPEQRADFLMPPQECSSLTLGVQTISTFEAWEWGESMSRSCGEGKSKATISSYRPSLT